MSLRGYKPKYKKALHTQLPYYQKKEAERIKRNTETVNRKERKKSDPTTSKYRYKILARAFVSEAISANLRCPVFAVFDELPEEAQKFLTQPWDGKRRSSRLSEVHHMHGRLGALLNYQPWWMAVSKWGHRLIHAFPKLAIQFGWMCDLGEWNKQPEQLS